VTGEREILLDQQLGTHMHRNEANLVALALDPKVQHPLPGLDIAHPQPAQFLSADAMIKQGGDGVVADALKSIFRRGIEQLAHLGIAKGWRRSFIAIRLRPLDPINRIAGHGVMLAEVVEQGRELAANAGGREGALLEVLAPGDA
jgi:hypothetical protein